MAVFRFALLLQYATDEREKAAQTLQQALGALSLGRDKLAQIEMFRSEYRQRFANSGQGGMTVTQWRDYQVFLAKLDQGVEQQQQEVARLEAIWQQAQDVWRECDKKVMAFEALRTRHNQAELRRENRNEQKMLDDFNNSRHIRNKAGR